MTRAELLRRVQAADFAAHDAALCLDTHSRDTQALNYYHKALAQAKHLREQYTALFGPLTREDVTDKNHWDWINEPWPWERGE